MAVRIAGMTVHWTVRTSQDTFGLWAQNGDGVGTVSDMIQDAMPHGTYFVGSASVWFGAYIVWVGSSSLSIWSGQIPASSLM